jgi:uncharacterized protein YegP (UPF0339 family)
MYFEIFKDRANQYRWRLVARNGKTVADSAEAYTRKGDLLKTLQRIETELQFDSPPKIVDKTINQ